MENHKCLHEDKIPVIHDNVNRLVILLEDENIGLCGRMKKQEERADKQNAFTAIVCFIATGIGTAFGYFISLIKG